MADGGKLPNHGQAGYLSRPNLRDPSHLVSQARDGYIAARVAELGNSTLYCLGLRSELKEARFFHFYEFDMLNALLI